MNNREKIAVVALSGGLDSSVTALLLKQDGYKVIGLTGKMFESPAAETIIQNAKNVADNLGIEHYVYDASKIFKREVMDNFLECYRSGKTPNPCILCNKFIKWGELFEFAINELKADIFATGHYANIIEKDGVYKLYPANDEHKDQLYFLYRLGQNVLSRTRFPLSKYKKSEVREIAQKYNLPSKSSKESQDICFIQKPMTTKKYLLEHLPERKGDFIELETGKKLGEHTGHFQYTIGQRKGIGIAHPHPLYVIDTDAEKNIVYVGREELSHKRAVQATDINLSFPLDETEFDAMVKIRYNMPAQKARVNIENGTISAAFYEDVNSVTAGQSLVMYDETEGFLIGGGTITA
ncbi:MAG: tRNA 2-thiouridine(34) synthase MnmA [Fusobacterium sp.]|nr:tRNA 2-thiouridine(34) synthase MnmA [Fusobacterium sp.]